jgi:hypothetical protein
MRCAIDTNVAIVANGSLDPGQAGGRPTVSCRLASIEFLIDVMSTGQVVIDVAGEIQEEYRRHLNPRGQPGVGDRFYLEIVNSNPARVARVELQKRDDGEYASLPQILIDTKFDRSDRKFAAIAAQEGVPVVNSIDSDWVHHQNELKAAEIVVRHLCGCDPAMWFSNA